MTNRSAAAPTPEHDDPASTARDERKNRVVRIQAGGKILYFGRTDAATARKLEDEKRDELARTGKVTGALSVRQATGCLGIHADDASLWKAVRDGDATENLPGEYEIMLAVIENARVALTNKSNATKRLEAERWFASNDRSYLYAFASICDVFNVDPELVRRGLFAKR